MPVAELLRVASLGLLTLVAFGASWALASVAKTETVAYAADAARISPLSRSLPRQVTLPEPELLRIGAPSVSLTVLDGGGTTALRAPRATTVAEALAVNGVELGPHDRTSTAPDALVSAGDVIRVVRADEYDAVVREPVAFAVETIRDAGLAVGRVIVATAGVPGLADNTYRVRTEDGAETGRTLVASAVIVTPVAEVRQVGTKPAPVPAEIESIIRSAAARWGADPAQLLRVAWCESRYNPSAYNASSGASGLFQFMPRTWAANSVRAGYSGASAFDAVASANTAAYMFSIGQAWQWSCK